jgi:hypothetical protein
VTEQDGVGGTITNRTLFLADFETNTEDPKDFYVSTNGNTDTYITDAITLDEFMNPTVRAEIYEVYDLNDDTNRTFENDDAAQNFEFEKEADDIIDFSEQNPFGEPS